VLVLGLVAALSLAGSASASKGTPCGKKVLGDWFDNGRIDRIYPLHCYEDAINQIPPDLRDYADAEDVITRALQSALHGNLAAGGKDPTPGSGSGSGGSAGGKNGSSGSGSGSGGSGGAQAAPDVNTSGPSSVPVPLLVLGGLSLALLAAGGLGYLSRRRQAAHADDTSSDDDVDPLS
jgi:hypothetical protein